MRTVTVGLEEFTVAMDGRPRAVDFVTLPYPGFATDLQPMAIALAAVADGTSMITENVFEARFRFVDEMMRLGADARTDGHHAVVRGVEWLSSAPVWASDIRAGAGLVLAGLCADGETEVWDVDAHRPRLPALRREPARAGRGHRAGDGGPGALSTPRRTGARLARRAGTSRLGLVQFGNHPVGRCAIARRGGEVR